MKLPHLLIFMFTFSFYSLLSSEQDFWFKGSVEEALLKAKKENKLLFLSWGAKWCPPCNELKNTLFKNDDFKKAIKNYISIYLDGDTPRAQVWGEKLKAKGYPTLLVLNANQTEISRLNPSSSTSEIVSTLKILTPSEKNTKELLDKALQGEKLEEKHWEMLSLYSWDQDHFDYLGKDSLKIQNLKTILSNPSISSNIKTKNTFMLFYISELAQSGEKLSPKEKKELKKSWRQFFKDKDFIKNNLEYLIYSYSKVSDYLFKGESENQTEILAKFYNDKNLSPTLRLMSLSPQAFIEKKILALKKVDIKDYQKKTDSLLKEVSSPEEFQSFMSSAIYFHSEINNSAYAFSLAKKAIEGSKSPFYFMNYLSYLYDEKGKVHEALMWSKKSWKNTVGNSTKIEYATRYIEKIIKYKSQISEAKAPLFEILDLTAKSNDLLKGRGESYLKRLEKSLKLLPKKEKSFLKKESQLHCKNQEIDCSKAINLLF